MEDEAVTPKLLQADSSIQVIDSDDYPNTENDLLAAIVNVGYLPDDSINLMEGMNSGSSGIMTSTSNFSLIT